MKNPFRTEESAFRFLVLTIAYGALIVIGSKINTWIGLTVFIVETTAVAWWLLTQGRRERPILVANETVGGAPLLNEIRRRSEGVEEHVLVVVPALNSPLKHWVSDEDGAREAAQQRLEASLAAMRKAGIDASGEVGDGDPLQAIEDALRTFAPDELVISTHPEGRSNWLERGVVEGARERFALPVTHVVVDLNAKS
jgi:GABA permease